MTSSADMYGADDIEDVRLGDAGGRRYLDALGISQTRVRELDAEVKRLRIQLGCVKALATLWEESAAQMEQDAKHTDSGRQRIVLIAKAESSRSHTAALRDMLMETPEDDVVEAVILCGQSSGMFRVAECSLPDGHDGQHEDSNTGWMWGK